MPLIRFATLALAALFLSGCAALVPDAQRPEIQQGNLLSNDDIAALEKGQTRARVRELIGEPILGAPFRRDRWDYVYYRARAGRSVENPQRLTLYFDEQDRVASIQNRYQPPDEPVPEGDVQPLPDVDTHGTPTDTDRGPGQDYPGT
ncbi:MAG: outer membrane protein assembly factor BamE [Halofilum sp. (in: g-proteobacteria)]|nr:outer membrane protein assembly factor BamE [Halofilum sp. (in: g-proteobacteria)]